ncbi:LOW QUALITY PROTEIN: uncharacterized protein LOC119585560 [Penaeus monodon]|uniref:LOW QUALITY PROTEIN: uncharacterized protein LOC119585560 n=1 Tax=Penaeus monodon TaxID=6687 RepID=UPI0018A7093E|nr:LOW QUALITY PROTEIN: uncharacterized protein LOC119585560 [Penaeus monodon]
MRAMRLVWVLVLVATAAQAQGNRRRQAPARGRPQARPATRADNTCSGDVSFELITGFVYSSADDIIDSKIGTLLLSECMEHCRANEQCQALNFETGLCVLFKTAAGENSAGLAVSQFPVFTLYAQKLCLPKERPPCKSPWVYETVPGLAVAQTFTADSRSAASRAECALMCILEDKFQCRAGSYNAASGTCTLAQVDRNMAGRSRLLDVDEKSDYLEVSCVPKPQKMCDFQSVKGRILKTVDAVFQDVESTEECQARCKGADFTCYSYDFMSASEKICRLSHHSGATLAHIQEPYLEIGNATTYEMQSCYQVTVECRGAEMLARISTSTLFTGKVYAKDRPNSCVMDVKNSTEFEIVLPYNDINCDVVQEGPGAFSTNIVIQHHDMIVTSADVGLALHCKYDLKNQTVTNSLISGLEVKGALDTAEYFEETIVESPNVVMRVTTPRGDDIFSAQVGDSMALRFEITDEQSPYEIFVRDLIAMDGQDSSEILLIDERGCPTDPTIMSSVVQMGSGSVLHAPFQAFKFPASDIVQFRALVTPCLPRCEPVQCSVQGFDGVSRKELSYGRKKREVHETDIMVVQSVRIKDKFQFSGTRQEEVEVDLAQETCSSFTGVVVACALFLAAQVVLLMAWSYLWHKKRATKQIDPNPPPSLYFGTTSSRTSSTSYLTD